jgi:hypothetical protein
VNTLLGRAERLARVPQARSLVTQEENALGGAEYAERTSTRQQTNQPPPLTNPTARALPSAYGLNELPTLSVDAFPHLSWYFQSLLALVEQRMNEISSPPWDQRINRNDFIAN